jgi:hypothetical protein
VCVGITIVWGTHRNLIYRMGIRTQVGFFTVQSNGASVVGKGKEEKFDFFDYEMFSCVILGSNIQIANVQDSL